MNETAKNRILWAIVAVLLIVIGALVYKFLVAGSTAKGDDGRTMIVLEPAERALVLREMRGFVAGLQQITVGLAGDDMKAVAAASRDLGAGKAHDVPAGLMGKLPLEFKKLAFATHGGFDTLATDADAGIPSRRALEHMSGILSNCVACHSLYQFGTPPPK